jgi:esterase/lipase superfamily enzyme
LRQYFIKIKEDHHQVSFGELVERKNRRVLLDYVKEEERPILSNPTVALKWIQTENTNSNSKILFFIHGLIGSRPLVLSRNSKVFRADYSDNKDITFVHVLWNNGKIMYKKNLVSLRSSTPILAELLNEINQVFKHTSIMCQSMGNRFFFETILKHSVEINFQEILLVAPDVDVSKFELHHDKFLKFSDKIFVFYHLNDRVLKHSSRINKIDRLGRVNLKLSTNKIKFIECTHLEIKKFPDSILKHMYFLSSQSVKQKINELLK